MIVVTETKVKINAPEGTLSTTVHYVGEDMNEALNIAANIIDFDILHNGYVEVDGDESYSMLNNGEWWKSIQVKTEYLRYWI